MTKRVISAAEKTKVTDVAEILTKNRIHGIPVIDKNNNITGIITMSDFFIKGFPNIYLPTYINFIKKSKLHKNVQGKQKETSNILLKSTAKDIMSSHCMTVSENDDVEVLLKKYRESTLKTLPVINKDNKLVGIVARSDIIKFINLN